MNNSALKLDVLEALKQSASFCLVFIRSHWIISLAFILILLASSFFSTWQINALVKEAMGSSTHFDIAAFFSNSAILWLSVSSLILLSILLLGASIIGYCFTYYACRLALINIVPGSALPHKTPFTFIWQLICGQIIISVIGTPFLLLLILPGLWWAVRVILWAVCISCTDKGPIEAVKESFRLTSNNFWQCVGFITGVTFVPAVFFGIVSIVVTFAVILPASMTLPHDQLNVWPVVLIKSSLNTITLFLQSLIIHFSNTWLYAYLKQKHDQATAV